MLGRWKRKEKREARGLKIEQVLMLDESNTNLGKKSVEGKSAIHFSSRTCMASI